MSGSENSRNYPDCSDPYYEDIYEKLFEEENTYKKDVFLPPMEPLPTGQIDDLYGINISKPPLDVVSLASEIFGDEINRIVNYDVDKESSLETLFNDWSPTVSHYGLVKAEPEFDCNDPNMKMVRLADVQHEEVYDKKPQNLGSDNIFHDHGYANLKSYQPAPIKIEIKDECSSDVDVWNVSDLPSPPVAVSYPVSPLPYTRNRRCKVKASQKVSIDKAARQVMAARKSTKRTNPSSRKMPTRKRRKFSNSLETSPSGSESEEPNLPMPPPTKPPSKRGGARKSTPAKPTKSEVQRNNHNQNEKMRRTHMTHMMGAVRDLIPQEFYEDRRSNSKAKASKQKILVAARAFVVYLKKQMHEEENDFAFLSLKQELTVAKGKLDKAVKRFMDKYQTVKKRRYSVKHR